MKWAQKFSFIHKADKVLSLDYSSILVQSLDLIPLAWKQNIWLKRKITELNYIREN